VVQDSIVNEAEDGKGLPTYGENMGKRYLILIRQGKKKSEPQMKFAL